MGNKTSTTKIHAEASLGAGVPSVDTLTFSSSASRCWGRGRRRLARFTFPRRGWVCTQGVQVCRGREVQHLPLVKLHFEDPSTAIRVKCSHRGAVVYAATMPLSHLLGLLEEAVAEDAALLLFSLAGGEDCVATLSFTRPGYPRPWTCNRRLRSCGGCDWEFVGQEDAACHGPREGGCGTPASPRQHELGQDQGRHSPVQADKADKATASAFSGVPQPVLRTLTTSHQEYTVPGEHCRDPSASAQDETVPEADLGELSSLALYRDLHKTAPETAPDEGDPPASAEAHEAVFDEESLDPAPSAQEASPPGCGRPWWHAVLEGLEVLDLVVYSLLIFDACLQH